MSASGEIAGPITIQWRINAGHRIFLLVIICGSLYLLLANLGNQYLWQDEAQTALVSKTILSDGVPHGYDGKNYFSQELGAEYGDNYIWRWHTWLPLYVLAGFYKIFGISTFVSRLPFALFGFGTVLLTYLFAKELWSGTRVPTIAAALLAICVPFLLLCRQCRYYSMTMFFSVLSLHAYSAMLNRKKYSAIMLVATSTLLFHSQHFYVAVLFSTVLLHACIFGRDRLGKLLLVITAVILLNAPWFLWMSMMKPLRAYDAVLIWSPVIDFIKMLLIRLMRYMFSPLLLVVVLIVIITRRVKTGCFFENALLLWKKLLLPIFFIIFNIIIMAVISPMPFLRYIAPCIPLLIILIAVIVDATSRVNFLLVCATVALVLITGQLKDFLYEITHDYDGPEEGIVRYLNEHGSPNEVVAITYGDMPLKFYTKMRIVGGLTGEDLEPAKNARWVIIRKYVICYKDAAVRAYLLNNIDRVKCRRIVLNYPDTPCENGEELAVHYFRTCTDEDRVVIYERID
jgi:4-amino-4-deoxy-L-arabinose transferase-like glycosyltransferase